MSGAGRARAARRAAARRRRRARRRSDRHRACGTGAVEEHAHGRRARRLRRAVVGRAGAGVDLEDDVGPVAEERLRIRARAVRAERGEHREQRVVVARVDGDAGAVAAGAVAAAAAARSRRRSRLEQPGSMRASNPDLQKRCSHTHRALTSSIVATSTSPTSSVSMVHGRRPALSRGGGRVRRVGRARARSRARTSDEHAVEVRHVVQQLRGARQLVARVAERDVQRVSPRRGARRRRRASQIGATRSVTAVLYAVDRPRAGSSRLAVSDSPSARARARAVAGARGGEALSIVRRRATKATIPLADWRRCTCTHALGYCEWSVITLKLNEQNARHDALSVGRRARGASPQQIATRAATCRGRPGAGLRRRGTPSPSAAICASVRRAAPMSSGAHCAVGGPSARGELNGLERSET